MLPRVGLALAGNGLSKVRETRCESVAAILHRVLEPKPSACVSP